MLSCRMVTMLPECKKKYVCILRKLAVIETRGTRCFKNMPYFTILCLKISKLHVNFEDAKSPTLRDTLAMDRSAYHVTPEPRALIHERWSMYGKALV